MVKEGNTPQKNHLLRVRLAEFDMSFAELARRADLHPMTVCRVYRGEQQLSSKTAVRVAEVLETTPEAVGLSPVTESGVAK